MPIPSPNVDWPSPSNKLSSDRDGSRDSRTHYRLKNWGAFKRFGTDTGPLENPISASWQGQVTGDYPPDDDPEEHYIDEEDAERVQKAILLCNARDQQTARILTEHYHHRNMGFAHVVRTARNKFWRYLY